MPVNRLWVSIYQEDDQAFEIWTKEVGVDPGPGLSGLEKRTISGNMAPAPAAPVLKSILTGARRMVAALPAVVWGATAIGMSDSGIWYLPSSTTTARGITHRWNIPILTPVWLGTPGLHYAGSG